MIEIMILLVYASHTLVKLILVLVMVYFSGNQAKGTGIQVRAYIHMVPTQLGKESAHTEKRPAQVGMEARTRVNMWHIQSSNPE